MRLFLPALGMLLCLSCASALHQPQQTSVDMTDISGSGKFYSRPLKDVFGSNHWVTRPEDSTITVIGIAGRRFRQEDAVAEALADAARRVSLYHGLYGECYTVSHVGTNVLDYYASTDYKLTVFNSAESYTDSLVFNKDTDVYSKEGSVYVRVQYSGVKDVPVYKSVMDNGVPSWVREFNADIPGFLAGIGASKNRGSPQKTWQASYENAIASLLPRLFTSLEGSVVDMNGIRVSRETSISKGALSSVMILETWVDKKTGTVWTLLAAQTE